jgi:glycosyltransferase involved in cell wall biosynthesis
MKLIIQIPCYNEEETLASLLKTLPKKITGFEKIEYLLIDDGSKDRSIEIAKSYNVHHIVSHLNNKGLAKTFMTGINECLKQNADVIVNIDADNQYDANCIVSLVNPILNNEAEIVIGERPINEMKDFTYIKKRLQKIGSFVVRAMSRTKIPDTTSGFRAYSRNAAKQLNVFTDYTYTLETIIQAGQKNMSIISVDIKVNRVIRQSKLVKSMVQYIFKSILTIFRVYAIYKPLKFFLTIGSIIFLLGIILGIRWLMLIYLVDDPNRTYLPSLILAAILLIIGFQTMALSFIGDLFSINRKLLEEIKANSIKDSNS